MTSMFERAPSLESPEGADDEERRRGLIDQLKTTQAEYGRLRGDTEEQITMAEGLVDYAVEDESIDDIQGRIVAMQEKIKKFKKEQESWVGEVSLDNVQVGDVLVYNRKGGGRYRIEGLDMGAQKISVMMLKKTGAEAGRSVSVMADFFDEAGLLKSDFRLEKGGLSVEASEDLLEAAQAVFEGINIVPGTKFQSPDGKVWVTVMGIDDVGVEDGSGRFYLRVLEYNKDSDPMVTADFKESKVYFNAQGKLLDGWENLGKAG